MSIQKTRAILLYKRDIRETSVIASFYTKDFGKIKALIKSARGPMARCGTYLHEFAEFDIIFYERPRADTHMVTQCDLVEPFGKITQDLDKRLKAFYVLELVDKFTVLCDDNPDIYKLLEWILRRLDAEKFTEKALIVFRIMLLEYTGFLPQIDSCMNCGKRIERQNAAFSLRFSGLLCQECLKSDMQVMPLSKGAVASIKMIRRQGCEKLASAMVTVALMAELSNMLDRLIDYHLGEHLKTLDFMKKSLSQ
ncbi:MAG: DNA repair protein RecO [Candidatus Omnitrophica bacterium]|nr:DNA repair protein RecO [Candidatus Omnitrophota bacterium]